MTPRENVTYGVDNQGPFTAKSAGRFLVRDGRLVPRRERFTEPPNNSDPHWRDDVPADLEDGLPESVAERQGAPGLSPEQEIFNREQGRELPNSNPIQAVGGPRRTLETYSEMKERDQNTIPSVYVIADRKSIVLGKANPHHVPAGSPKGGQFTTGPGGGSGRLKKNPKVPKRNYPVAKGVKPPMAIPVQVAKVAPPSKPGRLGKLAINNTPPSTEPAVLAIPFKSKRTVQGKAHTAFVKFLESSKLPPELKKKYSEALEMVINSMPIKAVRRMTANVKEVSFHESSKALTAKLGEISPVIAEKAKKGHLAIGAYVSSKDGTISRLELDGSRARGAKEDVVGKERNNAHETYAHELSHALDGPNKEHSNSREWQEAWKSEIAGGQLCKYAATKSCEGWAEFGRMIYGNHIDHSKIKARFPKAMAYWKKQGFVK